MTELVLAKSLNVDYREFNRGYAGRHSVKEWNQKMFGCVENVWVKYVVRFSPVVKSGNDES